MSTLHPPVADRLALSARLGPRYPERLGFHRIARTRQPDHAGITSLLPATQSILDLSIGRYSLETTRAHPPPAASQYTRPPAPSHSLRLAHFEIESCLFRPGQRHSGEMERPP